MKTRTVDRHRSERGQVLVIVALVFVGLVALAGLAVDGGNLFVQRRQAQNAADAAALAGARLIADAIQTCDEVDLAVLDNTIQCTINEYAEKNGIADTNGLPGDEVNDNVVAYYVNKEGVILDPVGAGTVSVGASGVRVDVQDMDETYFVQVAGIDEIPSSASAMALVGVINQLPAGAGLVPIAVPLVIVEALQPGEEWEVLDNKDGEFCHTDDDGTEICLEDTGAPHNAQRGWLNLNHIHNDLFLDSTQLLNRTFEQSASADGCPSDPTKKLPGLPGYASGLCPYAYPIIAGEVNKTNGDFIHGTSGAAETGVKSIYNNYAGQIAYAPIFDRAYLRDEMVDLFGDGAESPEGWPNGGGFSSSGGGAGDAYYYHIVGFTAFRVGEKKISHVVSGSFEAAIVQGGMVPAEFTGAGSCSSLLHGVMLWD